MAAPGSGKLKRMPRGDERRRSRLAAEPRRSPRLWWASGGDCIARSFRCLKFPAFPQNDPCGFHFFQSLGAISGVNLDDETLDLIRYQRAYQGAARFLSVIDTLLEALLST